jgi:SPP1 gp7 family putative phage head morphogenesis protein
MLEAYNQSPWLRAVVGRIGEMIAATPFTLQRVMSKDQKRFINHRNLKSAEYGIRKRMMRKLASEDRVVDVEDSPILDFLAHGNEILNGQVSRKMTHVTNDLIGNAFWIIERNADGMPVEYWFVPSTFLEGIDNKNKLWKFRIKNDKTVEVAADDVLWFKNPTPSQPYGMGVGSAQVLGDELDVDEYASKLLKATMYNKGRIDMVVAIDGASESEIIRAREEFDNRHRGVYHAGRSLWHSGKHSVTKVSQTMEELQVNELRAFERDFIINFYGYPPELLGLISNSNRATITQARMIRAEEVMIPRLTWEVAVIQRDLIDPIDDTLHLWFVDPRPDDDEFRLASYTAASHTVTINEWRDLQGLPNIGRGGDVFLVQGPFGLESRTYGMNDEEEVVEEEPEVDVEDDEELGDEGDTDSGQSSDRSDIPNPNVDVDDVTLSAKDFVKKDTLSKSDIDKIVAAVDDSVAAGTIDPVWSRFVTQTVSDEMAKLGTTMLFDFANPLIEEHLREFATDEMKLINDNTRTALRTTLVDASAENLALPDIAAKVKETLGGETIKNRATTIARTEVMRSANAANFIAMETSGIEKKEWVATFDARTRDDHMALDGDVLPLREEFQYSSGGSTLAPGDSGIASQDINCRCTLTAVTTSLEELSVEERLAFRKEVSKVFSEQLDEWESETRPVWEMILSQQINAILAALEEL